MTCACWYKPHLPEPPDEVKKAVNAALLDEGYEIEYEEVVLK